MANQNAHRDGNGVPTALGVSTSDGVSTARIAVNPLNRGLKISDGTSGSFGTLLTAPRDDNDHPVLMGVSSVDFKTPVPIATDPSTGALLTQST